MLEHLAFYLHVDFLFFAGQHQDEVCIDQFPTIEDNGFEGVYSRGFLADEDKGILDAAPPAEAVGAAGDCPISTGTSSSTSGEC